MTIDDVLKIKWIRDEEFPEKWYDSEICLYLFAKDNNPLATIFSKHGLDALVVNDILYCEKGKDLNHWDKDREYAAKNLSIIVKLIREQEKYIKKAEKFISTIKQLKLIEESELKRIKEIFTSLWYIFLSDLGKPFALEIELKLKNKRLKSYQIERVKDYLSGLEKDLPFKKFLGKDDIKFLESVRKSIFIDNYAANLYSKIDSFLSDYLYKKFDISFQDLSMYSFTELENLIKNATILSEEDLKERRQYRVMVQINGEVKCFYGKKNFEKIKAVLSKNPQIKKVIQFSGLVASLGIAKGLVKIVKVEKDMEKVNIGDILVAPTTRPELMSALRRCAAIVTDTGGITSHAAIISRELKVPCIVGTDIATQVLKDGDLIEVNANKGVVTLLK